MAEQDYKSLGVEPLDGIKGTMTKDGKLKLEPAKVERILPDRATITLNRENRKMREPKTTQDYVRESARAQRVARAERLKAKGSFQWWYAPLAEVGDGLYWRHRGRLHRIGLPLWVGAKYRRWRAG